VNLPCKVKSNEKQERKEGRKESMRKRRRNKKNKLSVGKEVLTKQLEL